MDWPVGYVAKLIIVTDNPIIRIDTACNELLSVVGRISNK